MALARKTIQVQDNKGNAVTDCQVEVRRESVGSPLASLFADRAGTESLGNPMPVDVVGTAAFHVVGGAYRIRAFKTGFERIWRYVGVGLGAESDIQLVTPRGAWDSEETYQVGDMVSFAGYLHISSLPDNQNNEPPSGSPPEDTVWWMVAGGAVKGDKGDPGDPGTPFNWRGAWSAGTYDPNDAVQHGGSSWITLVETTDEPGVGSPNDWELSAAKGEQGDTGGPGPQGDPGAPFNWEGAWSAGTYQPNDAVEHNGSSWTTRVETTDEPGVGSPNDWELVAAKGEKGDTGDPGAPGAGGDVEGPDGGVVAGQLSAFSDTSGKLIEGAVVADLSPPAPAVIGDDAGIRAATPGHVIHAGHLETASAFVPLTDAATVAVDWATGINFFLTITANRTLGNPTNGQPGTWRTVYVESDGGPDTLGFDTQYFGPAVDGDPLDDIAGGAKVYLLTILCVTASVFFVAAAPAEL